MKILSNIKPSFLRILILIIPILLLCSCGNDEEEELIWDMAPVNVMIHIQDSKGNNLLSPSVSGNLQGKKIVAEYQDEKYELNWNASKGTRFYMPFFSGLTLQAGYTQSGDHFEPDQNKNYLSFGEFDGAQNQDITISLTIDGYPDPWVISVSHSIKWKGNTPLVTNTATLNGTPMSYDKIIIVL